MGGCLPYLLFVLLLVVLHSYLAQNDLMDAHIRMCKTNADILMIASGTDLQLCCNLTDSLCNSSEPFLLTLGKKNMDGKLKNMSIEDPCHVELQIMNVSASDGGQYVCQYNSSSKDAKYLTVVDKPAEPEFVELLISDRLDVIVRFNIGPFYEVTTTEHRVYMNDRNVVTEICRINCSLVEMNPICECKHSNNEIQYVLGKFHKNTTFTIQAARPSFSYPLQSVEIKKSFNLYQHVVPGCVENLKLLNLGPNESTIVFAVPRRTSRIIDYMNSSSKPLVYHVVLHQTEGVPEIIEVMFTKTSSKKFVAVQFPNLNANTKYIVTVSGIGGGGEGCRMTLEFKTNKTVPSSPPDIDEFSFTNVLKNSSKTFMVMWKALPQSAMADSSVSYNVTVTGSNGVMYSSAVNETYHYIDSQQASFPLSVKIWAVNSQGVSTNYSEIIIPEIKDTDLPETTIVELMNENMASISVNLESIQQVEQVLIHWCVGPTGSNICNEYPNTIVKNVSSTFQVDLDLPVNNVSDTELIPIEWYDFAEGDNLSAPSKVNATKTVNPSDANPQYSDPFSFVQGDTSKQTRRKRSKNLKHRKRMRLKKSAQLSNSPEDGLKVFISYKNDGVWSGMVPTSCYYDRRKSEAQIISSIVEENDKQNLRLRQQCDNKGPQQFLIKIYDIFTSTDERCLGNKLKLNTLINPIFKFSLVEIPQGTKFICFKGIGNDEATTEEVVKAVTYPEGSTESTVIIISVVVGTILTGVAFAIIIKLVCVCKKRKKYFIKMQETISPHSDTADQPAIMSSLQTKNTEEEQSRQNSSSIIDINRLSTNLSSGVDSGHGSTNTSASENQSMPSTLKQEELVATSTLTLLTSDESVAGGRKGRSASQDTECDDLNLSTWFDSEDKTTHNQEELMAPSTSDDISAVGGEGISSSLDRESGNVNHSTWHDSKHNMAGDNLNGDDTTDDYTTGDDTAGNYSMSSESFGMPGYSWDTVNELECDQEEALKEFDLCFRPPSSSTSNMSSESDSRFNSNGKTSQETEFSDYFS